MNIAEMYGLNSKNALVTGASKGIGFGICQALIAAGANVTMVARDAKQLEIAADKLRNDGGNVKTAAFDLGSTGEIASWYANLCSSGAFDILVNNAGTTKRAPAHELELEDWNNILNLNLTAVFALSKAFGNERISSGRTGKIINIASLMTAASRPGTSAYTASKGGIGQLTKALAVDWADKGILVNAVAPGYIATSLTEPLQQDPKFDQWVKQRCPLGRWGTPTDIAIPVVFLASRAADFITGQTLYVDGGWMSTF